MPLPLLLLLQELCLHHGALLVRLLLWFLCPGQKIKFTQSANQQCPIMSQLMFVLQCISCLLQTVYDQHFITLFNIVYTSLPVLAMGIFDQVCLKYLCLLGVFEFKTETVAPEIIAFPRTLRTQSQQTEIKTTRNSLLCSTMVWQNQSCEP